MAVMKSSERTTVRRYVAAWIDVLNQKEGLKKLNELPVSEADLEAYIQTLKETVGVVDLYRRCFPTAFASIDRGADQAAQEDPRSVSTAVRKLESADIMSLAFSDTMLYWAPVDEESSQLGIAAVHKMFLGLSIVMGLTLSRGLACRGGIDVGWASDFFPDQIYGPLLTQVYRLESREACWPRLVAGEPLVNLIQNRCCQQELTLRDNVRRTISNLCRDLICRAPDDVWMLDYLGAGARAQIQMMGDLIQPIRKFVHQELKRFRSACDKKLTSRYEQLHKYVENSYNMNWK